MKISQYQVGQIPLRPLSIQVNDSNGQALDLSYYTSAEVVLIGSDNENVDLSDATVNTGGARQGRFTFVWPKTRSLFTKPGDYLLQLKLVHPDALDYTTTHAIRVREPGRRF